MSTYEISKSSLLSLKAEILRKEQDLTKAKGENEQKAKIIKKKTPLDLKNKGIEERSKNDMTEEEIDLLKLSSSKLTQKAVIYDKLAQQKNQSEDVKRRYLVQFDKKIADIQNEVDNNEINNDSDEDDTYLSKEYGSPDNSDDEWVEYIDCLGRSRTCLKKDLEYLKSKEADLRIIAKPPRKEKIEEKVNEEIKEDNETEEEIQAKIEKTREQELLSGDMKREMLRQQWEKEEFELMNKNSVHYQDVLFSEARQHGVGYYSFSKDEEERAKQQEALKKLREETEEKQKKAQDLKALRERQLAARMKAARNRKRARMGLPPEEDEPEENIPQETKEKSPEPTEIDKTKIEEEKRLEEARKKHVRPWDVGKEGVKEFYEMTQEEWNDKQRQQRVAEFAPPNIYNDKNENSSKKPSPSRKKINPYLRHNELQAKRNSHSSNSSESDDKDFIGPPPPPNITDSIEAGLRYLRQKAECSTTKHREFTSSSSTAMELPLEEEDKSLRFTTKKSKMSNREDSNSDDSDVDGCYSPKRSKTEDSEVEEDHLIGPPAPPNISQSIEAGLRFLREKAEKKQCRAPW